MPARTVEGCSGLRSSSRLSGTPPSREDQQLAHFGLVGRQVNAGQLLAGPLEQFASNVLVNCLCAEPGPHFVLMDQTDKRWILSGDK